MNKSEKTELARLLGLSNIKKSSPSLSAAIAYTNGEPTSGISIKSKAKILDMPAVRSSIVNSCNTQKPMIDRILVVYPKFNNSNYHFDLKYVVDHVSKTKLPIRVEIFNDDFTKVFDEVIDEEFFKSYNTSNRDYVIPANIQLDKAATDHEKLLSCLQLAITKKTDDAKYGMLIKTKDSLYRSSQYSGLDENSTVHAEIGGMMQLIVEEDFEVETMSLISTKFPGSKPPICGTCLQLIAELSAYYGFNPRFKLHSLDGHVVDEYNLKQLLPHIWDNKKGEKHG